MLEIQELSVAKRIQNLTVRIPNGQFVGVIGANGAGKSTLLQGIAGLTADARGTVRFNETKLQACSAQHRRQVLAYLPQFSQFSEPVQVIDLLTLSQTNIKATPNLLAQWREEAIASFAIDELSSRVITELSGGEQRRVAIACMATTNRPLMLLDEPVAGLDLYYQLLTMDWLKACALRGATVIVAIHDLALAAQYCDQLLLLKQGHKLACGSPNKVLSDTNLADAFHVEADWLCNAQGVAMLAKRLPR